MDRVLLGKIYPKLSRYLIKEFLQVVVEVSIVELLALFVTFGAESFVKGPVILLTGRRSPELAVRWAPNIDCDYPWKLGKT